MLALAATEANTTAIDAACAKLARVEADATLRTAVTEAEQVLAAAESGLAAIRALGPSNRAAVSKGPPRRPDAVSGQLALWPEPPWP
jgi:hypothetical protein